MKAMWLVGVGLLCLAAIVWYGNSLWGEGVAFYGEMTQDTPLPSVETFFSTTDQLPEGMGERANAVVEGVSDTVTQYQNRNAAPVPDPFPTPPEPRVFLSEAQRAGLQAVGVDTATIPQTMTPEIEACFVAALGQQRVDSIVAGAAPNFKEFITAQHCIR